ncbi:P-loop containing nucleoside triphosphate hydrolase protein [Chytridium lagenaria]|nr:P-loop containing nucleoside triphosphate hydrolase protein [Chytridium lagenaria]
MFFWPIVGSGIWFFVEENLKLVNALLLGFLLTWFGDANADERNGYYYALLLSLSTILIAFVHHIDFWIAMRMGIQLRIAFIAAIYRKCLALSVSHTSSTGFIVNMVSNDVQRFEELMPFLHFIWIAPAQLLLVGALMYYQIENATFVAIGALVFLIPVQGYIAQWFGKYRRGSVAPRDSRLKTISDMLNGIMVVKLYAWEAPLVNVVAGLRKTEMDFIQRASILRAINEGFFFASSRDFSQIFAFGAFFFMGGIFTPSKVFTTITLLTTVRLNMGSRFPKVLQFIAEAMVSFRRIQNFLSLPEISQTRDPEAEAAILKEVGDPTIVVYMRDCSFRWTGDDSQGMVVEEGSLKKKVEEIDNTKLEDTKGLESGAKVILRSIDVVMKDKELTAIIGPVGAGKSSFLNAILGEMDVVPQSSEPNSPTPKIALRSRKIAFASQTPWILSDTIRNNILFGRPYRPDWFAKVIEACAMDRDVKLFPEGIETVVGERGVTLSGGQKARLALARAVYEDQAELYLMDDPLSAVDTKVGRQMPRSRHPQLQYIIDCDSVILLDSGKMASPVAPYRTVMNSSSSDFASVMREHANRPDDLGETIDDDKIASNKAKAMKNDDLLVSDEHKAEEEEEKGESSQVPRELKKEEAAKGDVPLSLYLDYFRSGAFSRLSLPILVIALVLGQALLVLTDYWLGVWASQSPEKQREAMYPIVSLHLLLPQLHYQWRGPSCFLWSALKLQGSSFFSAPLQFFIENPSGRVMNRMSTDLNRMDESLPWTFFDFVQCLFLVIGTLAVAVSVIPYVLLFVPVIGIFFYYLRKNYLQASRQVKAFYSNIPATLEGLSVVRAFGAESRFLERFANLQNTNTRMAICFLSAVRWLGLRLDFIAAAFSYCGGGRPGLNLNASAVGLVLSYSLQLMGLLQWCFRQSAEVENIMTATERVIEYTDLPSEFDNPTMSVTDSRPGPTPQASASSLTSILPHKSFTLPSRSRKTCESDAAIPLKVTHTGQPLLDESWPARGEVKLQDLRMSYPGAPTPALDGISVTIPAGSRVGIVGRTGAGKSSLLQALFRLVEPEGAVLVDGVDTKDIGLRDLRAKISIIPQDPFWFQSVLEKVKLKNTVEEIPEKLDAPITENGSNWSVGERQLICLGRAILRSSKLFVMDEATSAIDLSTDAFLASVLRSQDGPFANATILTIAHRLNTIIDYDYVMVMDQGRLVEFGRPHDLLSKSPLDAASWFSSMVSEMAPDAQNLLREIAFNKHVDRTSKEKLE